MGTGKGGDAEEEERGTGLGRGKEKGGHFQFGGGRSTCSKGPQKAMRDDRAKCALGGSGKSLTNQIHVSFWNGTYCQNQRKK